jgi:hypothetical protein
MEKMNHKAYRDNLIDVREADDRADKIQMINLRVDRKINKWLADPETCGYDREDVRTMIEIRKLYANIKKIPDLGEVSFEDANDLLALLDNGVSADIERAVADRRKNGGRDDATLNALDHKTEGRQFKVDDEWRNKVDAAVVVEIDKSERRLVKKGY